MNVLLKQYTQKSLLSGAKNRRQDKGTSCHHFDTTNIDFADIESEIMSFFCENTNNFENFWCRIGLSIW
jgi:hypothetical protein